MHQYFSGNMGSFRQLTGIQFRRQESEKTVLGTTLVGPVINRRLIHLPGEYEWFIATPVPHAGYFLANPIPLPVPPDTVRPPAIHTAPDE